MHGISNDIRKISDHLVTADSTGARAISRVAPDTPPLVGQRRVIGLLHTFTPDQVRSLPILGPDGKVVGVSFPSKLREVKKPWTFTPDGLESARHVYDQFTRGRGPQQPKWVYVGESRAPWGEETVFARAHAQENGYYVQVKKKIPFTKWSRWVGVRVNGETYGTLLAADKNFKQAAKGAPTAELVQMSCSPAAGSAAAESAESLASAGIGFDVHATEKDHTYRYLDSEDPEPGRLKQEGDVILGHGSAVELNESGDPTKSPWVKFEASGQRPNAQD